MSGADAFLQRFPRAMPSLPDAAGPASSASGTPARGATSATGAASGSAARTSGGTGGGLSDLLGKPRAGRSAPSSAEPVRPGGHGAATSAEPVRPGGHGAAPSAGSVRPGGHAPAQQRGTSPDFGRSDRARDRTESSTPSAPATPSMPAAASTPAPPSGGGLLDLSSDQPATRSGPAAPSTPSPSAGPGTPPAATSAGNSGTSNPGGGASSGGLLDLFGDEEPATAGAAPASPTPSAPSAPPAGAPGNLLDLSPEPPAAAPAPQHTQTQQTQSQPAAHAAPAGDAGATDQDAPRRWTDHFPHVRDTWKQDDLRQGPRVVQFDRVQSGTGHLTFSQPEGLGTPGLVQAVAQLADGRIIGAPQGVRNRDPLVDYSARSLKIHLRLLSQLQRFLVVFTPPQGLTADAAAVVRMEDDYSQGSYEAHVKKLGSVRHVAAFSGFVVDGHLVVRAENRPFTGGIMEPFAAFGYALGAPQALGLMEHP
ncbi:hypothetical protein [Galactobacter caseinivorans]|uniref:Uncharacterized protein n=1 Tax=Galactobacter caseinivorans TaxID=2676123 RepID=A0A496PGL9_9MICC|nr:hypothetical protein [Galactobacter caseinivorans]RKW69625.1 hypothetical protein DWQ67_12630 [Galactobacter caseinivorans]